MFGGGRIPESGRALSPLVGVVALLAITVCLAGVVAVGAATWSLESTGPTAAFDLSVDTDAEDVEIAIDHVAGDPIDVRELSVAIAVDGEDLAEQPPVPAAGANGFNGTPTGPFNEQADPEWQSGERASVFVAETNDPVPTAGDAVTVRLAADDRQIAALEAIAS
ncbi:type IV pilin N-terminal domain-containing protein [Natrialba sp. INN-245]|uniref:type IV pilin N-terminal domain-containing protein n=1 Tax=Natrialba sp. INN-245 TaxID=2690967 RepID=UPI001312047B|nr:type IV pilin N-terminal domain-containing protein [Natrialba sp. INN-245]MWV38803.1 type IV pilin [Natrialba sp. INN-245]